MWFLDHNATYNCSKCYKRFHSHVGSMDYSGFDRDTWVLRDCSLHHQHCQEISNEFTKISIRKKEPEFGVRNSVLLSLSYFDLVRYTVIDVKHNLFLGTGKNMFKV